MRKILILLKIVFCTGYEGSLSQNGFEVNWKVRVKNEKLFEPQPRGAPLSHASLNRRRLMPNNIPNFIHAERHRIYTAERHKLYNIL